MVVSEITVLEQQIHRSPVFQLAKTDHKDKFHTEQRQVTCYLCGYGQDQACNPGRLRCCYRVMPCLLVYIAVFELHRMVGLMR